MTVYALRLENNKDTAPRVRMGDGLGLAPGPTLLSTRTGLRPEPGAGKVTQVNGTMQVTVAPFMGWVDGGVSVQQGGYPVVNDDTVVLTLAAGDAALSRTDVVAVVVNDDSFDGSGKIDATVRVVQGIPGGGVPVMPTNSLALANVTVPAGLSGGNGGLASSHLTDKRVWVAAGGTIPVASQAERDALPAQPGLTVLRLDTNRLEVRGTSGWEGYVKSTDAPFVTGTYAPAVGGVGTDGTQAANYSAIGPANGAIVRVDFNIPVTGPGSASFVSVGLPPGMTAKTVNSDPAVRTVGLATVTDAGTRYYEGVAVSLLTTTAVGLYTPEGLAWRGNSPVALVAGDLLTGSFTFIRQS